MAIDLEDGSLQLTIAHRGFQSDADVERFLLFGEQIVRNVLAASSA